jgi:hypothetical protein
VVFESDLALNTNSCFGQQYRSQEPACRSG